MHSPIEEGVSSSNYGNDNDFFATKRLRLAKTDRVVVIQNHLSYFANSVNCEPCKINTLHSSAISMI